LSAITVSNSFGLPRSNVPKYKELLALRTESNRVLQQQLVQGTALSSQADLATAQEFDAKTLLLQSQLDYTQANGEIIHAMGRTPESPTLKCRFPYSVGG